ncbi:MAG: Fe-S cluster protein [Deltaproteobacteria bacterium]|nr:MAG: Fe-S cluster protein [Deltaproteobacteria bacterium]
MAKFNTTMDVFKLLEKTNCRKCNKPTCLAFAAAVFQGQASLSECPFIDEKTLNAYGGKKEKYESKPEQAYLTMMGQLRENIKQTNLEFRADILGEKFSNGRLTLKIFGKDFSVDPNGEIFTDIHVNNWIAPPVLNYILSGKGLTLNQTWVPFRELETAKDWSRFFEHQSVNLFKKVADSSPSFFEDIIELFNGKPVENHYEADISLIIKPLPLLPILICYNHPEDGLDSDLNLFFDTTADKNLSIENIYTLTTGLANMFEKLAVTHG